MPEQVTLFRCSDGKTFDTLGDAQDHEFRIALVELTGNEAIARDAARNFRTRLRNDTAFADLVRTMVESAA